MKKRLASLVLCVLPLAVFAQDHGKPSALSSLPMLDEPAPPQAELPQRAVEHNPFIDALVSAYQTNPQLKAEREALKVLDEQVSEAFSGWRPSVTGTYEKGRRRRATGSQDWIYSDTKVRELEVEQPLFTGGEFMGSLKGARARMKAGRARLGAAEQQVLLNAVTAYVDVAEKAALLELSRKNVEVLKRHLEVSNARFEAGDVTRTDTKQAESRLARADAEAHLAEANLASAQAGFERVVGFRPGINPLPEVSFKLPATLEEARMNAESAAPEMLEAYFIEKAADMDIDVRTSDLLPDVSLLGTLNRTEGSSIPGVGNVDQDTLTVHVSVPLYQGGGEYARLRAAKNRHQQAQFNRTDTRTAVLENVTKAWHDYGAAQSVITSSEAAVDAAQSALEGIQEEYANGERTTLDVLDTEQDLFTNRVNLLHAKRNKIVLGYGLLASIGRLNAKELALPVEIYDPIEHYDAVKWLPAGF